MLAVATATPENSFLCACKAMYKSRPGQLGALPGHCTQW